MAHQAGVVLDKDQFNCPICLDVLRDPVTIPCGHSYCSACIKHYWDQDDYMGVYGCPQCRQSFNPRPLLGRNTMLADVVERFRNTGLQDASAAAASAAASSAAAAAAEASALAGPGDVECDVCAGGRKRRAVRSCLVCLASYCEPHLQPHYESAAFKKHRLVPASETLRETICPRHDKLLEVYCRTDRQCICYLCLTDEHKGHDTVLAETEIHEKKTRLGEMKRHSQHKIREREREAQELRQAIMSLTRSTRTAIEESDKVFTELIRSIELKRFEVRELMGVQERTAVRQAKELLAKLEKETNELKRRDAELEKLSDTEDHVQFLQSCESLSAPPEAGDLPSVTVDPNLNFDLVMAAVNDFKSLLQEVCQGGFSSIFERVKDVDPLHNSNPRTRDDFLQYYNDLLLDANTANPYLILSEGRRGVRTWTEPQAYPENPERFTRWAQVLCRAGMAGRCYWEVEWRGGGGVSVGVCYKGMAREGAGSDCKLGHNSKSWSLDCSPTACSFHHNKDVVAIAIPCANRIGVYLDYRAGVLSFYSVPEEMILLHRVRTTFTQPLFPGFWVGLGSTLRLCTCKWR
ncbi:unnamed protein product [Merluccius merluccius]